MLKTEILIFIDLTKKLVGVILRKEEVPDSVGRLHNVLLKAVQCIANVWAALLFNSFYLLSKKGLSE